jgi:hypothetical protein
MKRALAWMAAIVTAMGVVLAAPAGAQGIAPASSAAPYCGIYWGSLPKTGAFGGSSGIVNIRAGQHDCYDRLVIDFDGGIGSYNVEYVPGVPHQAKEGDIPLRGGAFLQVDVRNSNWMSGAANNADLVNVNGWQTLRQVAAESYEGYTTVGIGVRARLPFRVFTLDGPGAGSRLVVDVANYW